MSKVVPVKLSLGELNTITEDDTLWVIFRPAIEALGLNVKTQMDKVKSRSWACVSLRDVQVPGDTQVRRHMVVDRRTLTMWLATVNENNVAEDKRDHLITFQREASDALVRYFHWGWLEEYGIDPQAVNGIAERLIAEDQAKTAEPASPVVQPDRVAVDASDLERVIDALARASHHWDGYRPEDHDAMARLRSSIPSGGA